MKDFQDHNPIVIFLYFLLAAGIAMFTMHPAVLLVSFVGAFANQLIFAGVSDRRSYFFIFLLFLAIAIINPLCYHNGVTVLFMINDSRITLEALLYGICAGGMIVTVILWFKSFQKLMTSDRLLYVFAAFSERFALVLSMAIRYVPLFGKQLEKTEKTQKAIGLYKEDNGFDTIKGNARVFSILVTWGLENGIITADSMTARGYGTGKRSFYSIYRFTKQDLFLLIIELILSGSVIFAMASGNMEIVFYPEMQIQGLNGISLAAVICYFVLSLLPLFYKVFWELKWKYLMSKI